MFRGFFGKDAATSKLVRFGAKGNFALTDSDKPLLCALLKYASDNNIRMLAGMRAYQIDYQGQMLNVAVQFPLLITHPDADHILAYAIGGGAAGTLDPKMNVYEIFGMIGVAGGSIYTAFPCDRKLLTSTVPLSQMYDLIPDTNPGAIKNKF